MLRDAQMATKWVLEVAPLTLPEIARPRWAVACFGAGTAETSDYGHWLDTLRWAGHAGSEIGHVLDTLAHERPFVAAGVAVRKLLRFFAEVNTELTALQDAGRARAGGRSTTTSGHRAATYGR
jgi:hypothetical protein